MNILVTGYKGFIGSYVYWKLRILGHTVFGLDRKDGKSIQEAETFPSVDVVVHCAANLFDHFEENIEATQKLVAIYSKSRFIFCSSAAVYGNCSMAKEDDELFPFGEYGKAKLREETIVQTIPDHVIFRLSNVYGLGTDHGFIYQCAYGCPNLQHPDHIRDYVYVVDVASAIVSAVVKKHYQGIYNLSTGRGIRNIDVFRHFYSKTTSSYADSATWPQEIVVSTLNPEKALHLGFHPRKNFL